MHIVSNNYGDIELLGNSKQTFIDFFLFRDSKVHEGVNAIAESIPRNAFEGSSADARHHLEWIAACKGGQPGGSNFDWAGPLTEVVLLGNVAIQRQMREELTTKKLLWDGAKFRFTNSDAANQLLKHEYRGGWAL